MKKQTYSKTRICYIGETEPQDAYEEKKEMRGKLIMPGFYNCHTHAAMVLLRGVGSDLPLDQWLFGCVVPIEEHLTPELIKTGSELAMLEMIAGGTVSFSDMYFYPRETAAAVLSAGMKANLNRPVQDFAFDPPETAKKRVKESLELFRDLHGAGVENRGNMHIHLSETAKEHLECKQKYGKTPARWFYDLGAFDSSAFAAHCVTLEPEDIALLKEKNVSIVHNPTSNMKLGSGIAPIPKYLESGLNVCIGTDGAASNNNLNMFEEMHLSGVVHNGAECDATVMPASTVLQICRDVRTAADSNAAAKRILSRST